MEDDPKEISVPSKFPQAFLDVQVFIDHCLKSQPYSVESTLYLINPNLLLIFGKVLTGKMSVHDQLLPICWASFVVAHSCTRFPCYLGLEI